MFAWIAENIATILIAAGVLLLAALAVRSLVKSRKKGGCASCPDAACGSCPYSAGCGPTQSAKTQNRA